MKSKLNKKEILKQFKGVQTLYHCENSDVQDYVLESLDNMPKAHKNVWENISYGNDNCDTFHLGNHDYIGEEIHIKFWCPTSFINDWDNEQYNQWTLICQNGFDDYLPIDGTTKETQKHFNALSQLLDYIEDWYPKLFLYIHT